ncbi:MAG: RNA polymerase subunit sigma, partial [Calditrichaeota bacterium]|nr:RNA polymerase subunit sigma [Calditrichota bacterium]
LSYKEIADVMGTSVSSVEARLHRAKVALAKKLADLLELGEDRGAASGEYRTGQGHAEQESEGVRRS